MRLILRIDKFDDVYYVTLKLDAKFIQEWEFETYKEAKAFVNETDLIRDI